YRGHQTVKVLVAAATLFWFIACAPVHKTAGGLSDGESAALKVTLGKSTRIDFPTVQRFVLQGRCVTCHNPKDLKDGVDLTTYASVINGRGDRKFIQPFNAPESAIYTVLTAKGDRHMPPIDHPQLTEDQITLVYLWIENGAKPSPDAVVARPPS